jgi:DNA invertase Pin-like site-specific DNA recombinase
VFAEFERAMIQDRVQAGADALVAPPLASKKLNLEMLIERRARAQERRVVPETIARFLREAAEFVPW